MLGILRVIQISNGYILITARSMVLPLLETLYKYIVQARVTLADASDYFARIALQTDRTNVTEHPLLPANPAEVLQNDSVIHYSLNPLGVQQRFLIMCLSADEAIELWEDFSSQLQVAGFSSWRLADIKAGLPAIYPQTTEQFVLQMANLGVLGGVSFKKGCYPGSGNSCAHAVSGKVKAAHVSGQTRNR